MDPNINHVRETVVLVHGFGGKRFWMQLLASRLRHNFNVRCFSYPTMFRSIESHAQAFLEWLDDCGLNSAKLHLVAHSMGAIISRAALNMTSFGKIRRFVMLAPPNNGSPVAKLLSKSAGRIFKPIDQLSSDQASFVNNLPVELPCQSGIIAARFDTLVPIKSTKLPTVSEHVVLRATHNSLLFSNRAAYLTTQFLQHGSFQ